MPGETLDDGQNYKLPVLRPEIGHAMFHERQAGMDEFDRKAEERFKNNNQTLWNAVEAQMEAADRFGIEGGSTLVKTTALILHELLARQAEADSMRAHFNQPPGPESA